MNDLATLGAYGTLSAPSTLTIQRVLPGPIERVWAYLTDSELRRQWLAAGEMEMKVGAPFELVWRNDELNDPPSRRPGASPRSSGCRAGSPSSTRRADSPSPGEQRRRLVRPRAEGRRGAAHPRPPPLPDRATMTKIGAGWHMHLDILVARATGEEPAPFWDGWSRLQQEYDRRLPA